MSDEPLDLADSLFSKVYVPAPSKPAWFDGALSRLGGYVSRNMPRLRVIWGCDERDRDNPAFVKYPGPHGWIDRWILEVFRPPEFFGRPEVWEQERTWFGDDGKTYDMGPYPSRGRYCMVRPLTAKNGQYVPCSAAVFEWISFHHRQAELAPMNVYHRKDAYRKLVEQNQKLQEAAHAEQQKKRQDLFDYYSKNSERINAEGTRTYPILTPKLIITPEEYVNTIH